MGVKVFQITLQNPDGVYQPGEWIEGQVQLDIDEPTKARGKFIAQFWQVNRQHLVKIFVKKVHVCRLCFV